MLGRSMVAAGGFEVEWLRGSASAYLGRSSPEPAVRSVRFLEVDRPALVLGSTQRESVADKERAGAAGVAVTRRRSGGGAVLLIPGDVLWVDVVVPIADTLYDHDVGKAFGWLGQVWTGALARVGVDGLAVHEGPLRKGTWSSLICFAGLGAGEVTSHGAKVVGMSQRRTMAGSVFQCAVLSRWDPEALVDVLALSGKEKAAALSEVRTSAVGTGVAPAKLAAGFEAALAESAVDGAPGGVG